MRYRPEYREGERDRSKVEYELRGEERSERLRGVRTEPKRSRLQLGGHVV